MILPVCSSSLTIESVKRSGPGLPEPHGSPGEPGKGAGFDTPTYRLPWPSKVGGYHCPPPELMCLFLLDHRFAGTSAHFHLVAPVAASIAHRTAWPLPA